MAEIEMKWYVMRAVSGKEAKVKEYIDAEIKNGRFGGFVSQVLIPTEKVVKVTPTGKRVTKDVTKFPGYVYVEAKLAGETAHTLRQTPNCLGFLPNSNNPEPLRPSEVGVILGQMEEEEMPLDIVIPYAVGEKVKVTDGPFAGFVGDIEEVNDEKQTLTVIVTVFGRNTPLSLGFTQVEKAGE